MESLTNPKIVGATVLGFALIAGAYLANNFGKPYGATQTAQVQASAPVTRVAIEVSDTDNNGIEDWRDPFINTEPIVVNQTGEPYKPPTTVTGQMSINFLEGILSSKIYGPFADSKEQVVERTIDGLADEAQDRLYSRSDIIIMDNWDDTDIVNYANTLANIILTNSVPNLDHELAILQDVVRNQNSERVSDLKTLTEVYRNYRDDTLKLPVPSFMVKQHLDLINTYQAIMADINAMSFALEDPVVALVRLKRYSEDASGLILSYKNIYLSLEKYYGLFGPQDPATFFVLFSPNYNN